MVSVPCSQVKRGVPATVAGHEVGVSVNQHAHHLHTRASCLIVRLYLLGLFHFRSCPSTLIWQKAVERFDCAFNSSAQQVSFFFTVYSCVCASRKLLLRVGYK